MGASAGELMNGVPAAMVLNGDILVTGVRWGNAVVCIQPKRGCAGSGVTGRSAKLHDPLRAASTSIYSDLPLASGRVSGGCRGHVGTHGNLEFLPGKSVGLSGACFRILRCMKFRTSISTTPTILRKVLSPCGGARRNQSITCRRLWCRAASTTHWKSWIACLGNGNRLRAGNPNRAHQLEHLIRGRHRCRQSGIASLS